MKKIKIIFISLFLGLTAYAQSVPNLPANCTAFRPTALNTQIIKRSDMASLAKNNYGQSAKPSNPGFWYAYSDRAENAVFSSPNSTAKCGTLSFNEKVIIHTVKNGWALVYSEDKTVDYPKVSELAKCRGWIPMTKLLLWNTCLANDKGIYEKAMVCANMDTDLKNGNLGKLFKNPSNTGSYESLAINFTYYFIMKQEGKMVLLSTQNTMNGISDQVLYGWVDDNSYVPWSQRSCLEPTWDTENVEYFAGKGVKVNIYEDASKQTKASYISFTRKDSPDPDRYRMSGSNLRYPILDNSTSSLWNCSTFSSTGKAGAINAGTTETKKSDTIIKKNLDELSNIRIAIVIDGTKSMEKYFPAVRDAIKECNSFFPKSGKVKVGVLIYRDKADGEYVTESFPMTNPDNPALEDFLNSGGKYGVKSSPKDKSLEEALYYGIDKALDTFGFKPEESNMMFVIGDCGNSSDYPEVTKTVIEDKLVSKNVTLMGFQVRNDSGSSAYTVFNNNLCDLIRESLARKFSALDKSVFVKTQLKKNSYEFVNNASDIGNSLYVGSHKYVQKGALDVNELKVQIETAEATVSDAIEKQQALVANAENGVSFGSSSQVSGPKLDQEWLKKRLGALSDEIIKKNSTVSFRGYTPKDDGAGHDYYKTVIFISQEELNNLIRRLKELDDVAKKGGNDREPYYKAVLALVRGMIPNITDAEINKLGMDEIMRIIDGIPANTATTKNNKYTLPQILNTKVVNANDYANILAKFHRQYAKLNSITKSSYKFVKESNGSKYYWIPTEDMP